MVRSSEIDDCTMLFMFTSARTRARNYIQALPFGLSFLFTPQSTIQQKEEVEKPPLCDSLGNMYVSVHKLDKQICKICDYHYFM